MKIRHVVSCAIVVLILLAVIHYFTHHKGQGVVGSFIPGA